MSESDASTVPSFDPDAAPDLSKGPWPDRLDKVSVARGRPRLARPKVSTTIRLSRDVIDHFRADGRGWQTRIDEALRDWISKQPVA